MPRPALSPRPLLDSALLDSRHAPPAAPELLVPRMSLVEDTFDTARRAVAVALVGATLILVALLVERLSLTHNTEIAWKRSARAEQLAVEVRLADERLSASTRLAVATGDAGFARQYDADLPRLVALLAEARRLAPRNAAARFNAEAGQADAALSDMRDAAFEAIAVGEVTAARRIFEGERFQHYTALLSSATDDLTKATIKATQNDVNALQSRARATGFLVLTGTSLLSMALWRWLAIRLERSRASLGDVAELIRRLATSDLLTGLGNRVALHDAMATSLARIARDGGRLSVLMVDLDRFKPVNDRHGHAVGDLVLRKVAERLAHCLRGGELKARYGGDEFVIVIEEKDDPTVAWTVAHRVVAAIERPMAIDGLQIAIGASIGIARFPDDALHADELLRRADSALYRAKTANRGDVCFYDSKLDEHVAERVANEQAMREGITLGQFVPYYQPIVDLQTRSVQSLELLCRWQHPDRGLVAPADFIPLAEETGLVSPMTFALLRQACRDFQRFPAHWRLSINVAPQQFLDHELVPDLLNVLREGGLAPDRLDVEMTETAIVSDTDGAGRVMQAMKTAGMTVTLDDFGTGYSSLAYLVRLVFDKIKIDQSFVRTLHERPESAKIVDAIIGMSRSLDAQTVAEGVETEDDARVLMTLGCRLAQGYLFSRPVPASEIEALVRRWDDAGARPTAISRADEPFMPTTV